MPLSFLSLFLLLLSGCSNIYSVEEGLNDYPSPDDPVSKQDSFYCVLPKEVSLEDSISELEKRVNPSYGRTYYKINGISFENSSRDWRNTPGYETTYKIFPGKDEINAFQIQFQFRDKFYDKFILTTQSDPRYVYITYDIKTNFQENSDNNIVFFQPVNRIIKVIDDPEAVWTRLREYKNYKQYNYLENFFSWQCRGCFGSFRIKTELSLEEAFNKMKNFFSNSKYALNEIEERRFFTANFNSTQNRSHNEQYFFEGKENGELIVQFHTSGVYYEDHIDFKESTDLFKKWLEAELNN